MPRGEYLVAFELARRFVYRCARPLELARWQYHFGGGTVEAVERSLSVYQNPDGGFGHAIEPDLWNPASTPIGTWAATAIMREVGINGGRLIEGVLRYLDSGADFDAAHNQWLNCVPGNNDHPHAVWWEYSEGGDQFMYNPTAALAGFIVRFADRSSRLYKKGCALARQAYEFLIGREPFGEQHVTGCFIELYDYLSDSGAELVDMEKFRSRLSEQVNFNLCRDTSKWAAEYVARPIDFFNTRDSVFYADNREAAEYQCEFIAKSQQPDGGWPVTWQWWNDYREFELAANWWRADFAVKNMLYLKNFGMLG